MRAFTSLRALLCSTFKTLPNANVVWLAHRPGTVLTVQALSEDDHKFWMQAMGGKEPVSQPPLLCSHLLTHTWHMLLYLILLKCHPTENNMLIVTHCVEVERITHCKKL